MKALDTNVLVRFLVKDDEQQAKTVYRLFKQAESKAEAFFIPILVVFLNGKIDRLVGLAKEQDGSSVLQFKEK